MRKSTHYFYDQTDIKKIIRDELEKAKPNWIEEMTKAVSKIVTEKFDKVMTVLDKFVGEIQSYREEQTLNQLQHDRMDKRIKKLEHPVL